MTDVKELFKISNKQSDEKDVIFPKNYEYLIENLDINKDFVNAFNHRNFLDENFQQFYKYIEKIKLACDQGEVVSANLTLDLSPEEISLLGDRLPYDIEYLDEKKFMLKDSYPVQVLKLQRMFLAFSPSNPKLYEAMMEYKLAKSFNATCIFPEYIKTFEKFLYKLRNMPFIGKCDEQIFDLHPVLFDVLIANCTLYFEKNQNGYYTGKLTDAGKDMVNLSNVLRIKMSDPLMPISDVLDNPKRIGELIWNF